MVNIELKYLFSPAKIGHVTIKNRIVRSATYERKAAKYGKVTKELIEMYKELAAGGAGLIITGAIAVDPHATGGPDQPYLYDNSYIDGQKKLVKAIHDYSDVKVAAQLVHTGRQGTHPKYPSVAPSPIKDKSTKKVPIELTVNEIREITKNFVDASIRAYECEYDMVQMHAAHGYLLSNFISPYTNIRIDEYGGNTQNRTKILIDIYHQIRDEIGKDFPIIVKLQTDDDVPGGLMVDEAMEITKILVKTGYDAIEPSGGIGESIIINKNPLPSKFIKKPEDENYFLPIAKKLKPLMQHCPLILVGGIRNPISAEKILKEKIADFISMSRPLIYEPDLPNRWKNGDLSPALCISCNSCFMTMMQGKVYCVVKKKLEEKKLKKRKTEL
ncbi:MAG: NADH:flavin oxidoreductase [Promethearchaeota archaeon]|nr:MAG: NADH:flavin oxidoreductase [Candidatus Lokiarchaeota archaeon]